MEEVSSKTYQSSGRASRIPRHCNCNGSDEKLEEQARARERQKAARDEEENTKMMMQEELFSSSM
jgi:hypothetical protein